MAILIGIFFSILRMGLSYASIPKLSELPSARSFRQMVVFMHGLGDTGSSWAPFFEHYHKEHPDTLFIFPDA